MMLRERGKALKQIGSIKLIGAECSDGVIIADHNQSIVWANSAALVMHQVTEPAELGATIDEYHARFQIRYVAVLPQAADGVLDASCTEYGRAHPEVLMEVRLPSQKLPCAIFRTRKTALFGELGHPGYIVFIMKTDSLGKLAEKLSDFLAIFRDPAAIARVGDGTIIAANAAYVRQVGCDLATQRTEDCTAIVEMDGEAFRLILDSQFVDTISASMPGRPYRGTLPSFALPDGVFSFMLDGEMRIVDVSQAGLDRLGYARNAVIGRKVFELMPGSIVERFERQISAQFGQSQQLHDASANFVTQDGKVVPVLLSAAMGQQGVDEQALLGLICVDVTPQKRLEESLAAMFAISPAPMLVHRCDDGRIIDANEAFLAVAGYGAADVVGRSFDEFGSFESAKRREAFGAAMQSIRPGDATEVTLKTSSGDKLDCVLTATKIWMLGIDCVLLVLQDVSDRRRTEFELMSALEAVMNDSSWFSRSVVERLAAMRAPTKSGKRAAALGDLTPRERDVLSLISLGLPDIEIAERLGLTKSTIRNHLSTLYSKIDVKNRGSAIIWARDRCLNVTHLPLRFNKAQSVFGPDKASRRLAVFGRDTRAEPV